MRELRLTFRYLSNWVRLTKSTAEHTVGVETVGGWYIGRKWIVYKYELRGAMITSWPTESFELI